MSSRPTNRKLTRSARLRKYESVYNSYMKQISKQNTKTDSKPKKKQLNDYQRFVKAESSKEKYKDMKSKERMSVVAIAWKKYSRRKKRI